MKPKSYHSPGHGVIHGEGYGQWNTDLVGGISVKEIIFKFSAQFFKQLLIIRNQWFFYFFLRREILKLQKDAMEKWVFSNERVNVISDIHKEVVSRVIE